MLDKFKQLGLLFVFGTGLSSLHAAASSLHNQTERLLDTVPRLWDCMYHVEAMLEMYSMERIPCQPQMGLPLLQPVLQHKTGCSNLSLPQFSFVQKTSIEMHVTQTCVSELCGFVDQPTKQHITCWRGRRHKCDGKACNAILSYPRLEPEHLVLTT